MAGMAGLECATTADRPDLDTEAAAAFRGGWPEFIFHDPVTAAYIERVERYFPTFDILLLDAGQVVAGGWGVPLRWSGSFRDLPDGYDGALVSSVESHEQGEPTDCLSIMATAVRDDLRGQGLAGRVLGALRDRASAAGLTHAVAPVRPPLKAKYPLTPMDDFATWARDDGLHLDPWIRTHQRLGATILGTAHRSMVVEGTVSEWEQWTGMALPQSGRYVIPGALDVLEVSYQTGSATYVEPNLWMQHV